MARPYAREVQELRRRWASVRAARSRSDRLLTALAACSTPPAPVPSGPAPAPVPSGPATAPALV